MAKRTANGANVTYSFEYTGAQAKIDEIADSAARQIYARAEQTAPYDTLTIAQKLIILDDYIKMVFLDLASAYKIQADMEAARDAAEIYTQNNYTLG